jgi:hypothetical protein
MCGPTLPSESLLLSKKSVMTRQLCCKKFESGHLGFPSSWWICTFFICASPTIFTWSTYKSHSLHGFQNLKRNTYPGIFHWHWSIVNACKQWTQLVGCFSPLIYFQKVSSVGEWQVGIWKLITSPTTLCNSLTFKTWIAKAPNKGWFLIASPANESQNLLGWSKFQPNHQLIETSCFWALHVSSDVLFSTSIEN